jgi:hypothetical protein
MMLAALEKSDVIKADAARRRRVTQLHARRFAGDESAGCSLSRRRCNVAHLSRGRRCTSGPRHDPLVRRRICRSARSSGTCALSV